MRHATSKGEKKYEYNYLEYKRRFTHKPFVEGVQEIANDQKISPQKLLDKYIQEGLKIDLEKKEIKKRKKS